jgi:hypothetical protein
MKVMTRTEAIDSLVARDVARWGPQEEAASRKLHHNRTHGLAISGLIYDPATDTVDEEMRRQAEWVMTAEDRAWLRHGGDMPKPKTRK